MQIFSPFSSQPEVAIELLSNSNTQAVSAITDYLPDIEFDTPSIPTVSLPNEVWLFIIEQIKDDKSLLSLSTTCKQTRSIYQDDRVYPGFQRQQHIFTYHLTTPHVYEELHNKLINKEVGKVFIPDPNTDDWKVLREQPLNAQLRGEDRHSALIKKTFIISWDLLLQPAVLKDRQQSLQITRFLLALFSHIEHAEDYVEKLFKHGLTWDIFHQLANIHLDCCIQLVAKYFPVQADMFACTFTHERLGIDSVSLLTALKKEDDPSVLFYIGSSFGEELLDLLLKQGSDLEKCNVLGHTPLLDAIYKSDIVLASLFLNYGANCNASDDKGNTPLIAACTNGYAPELVELLLKQPMIEVNARNNNGETALHHAARHELVSKMKILLLNNFVDINARTAKGFSVLEYAIQQNQFPVLQLLLQHPLLDTTASHNPDVSTLYFAIEYDQLTVVQDLLTKLDSASLCSAFNYAIWRKKYEIANSFLQNMNQAQQNLFVEQALALAPKDGEIDLMLMLDNK
jgi:ankyrin repeat protein